MVLTDQGTQVTASEIAVQWRPPATNPGGLPNPAAIGAAPTQPPGAFALQPDAPAGHFESQALNVPTLDAALGPASLGPEPPAVVLVPVPQRTAGAPPGPDDKLSVSDAQWRLEQSRDGTLPDKRPSGVQFDRASKRWRAFDYGEKSRVGDSVGDSGPRKKRKGTSFSTAQDACKAVQVFETGQGELPAPSRSVRPSYHRGPAPDTGMSDAEWNKAREASGGSGLPPRRPTAVKFFKKTNSWLVLECKRTGRPHLGYFKSASAAAEAVRVAENPFDFSTVSLENVTQQESAAYRERVAPARALCGSDAQWSLESCLEERPPGLTWSSKRRSWCVEKWRSRPWLGHFDTAAAALEAIRRAALEQESAAAANAGGEAPQTSLATTTAAIQRLKKLTEQAKSTARSINEVPVMQGLARAMTGPPLGPDMQGVQGVPAQQAAEHPVLSPPPVLAPLPSQIVTAADRVKL